MLEQLLTCSSRHRPFRTHGCYHTCLWPGSWWKSLYSNRPQSSFWLRKKKWEKNVDIKLLFFKCQVILSDRNSQDTAPVFSCFLLKHSVTVLNPLFCQSKHLDIWILPCYPEKSIEDPSFPVPPHDSFGTPEDVRSVSRMLEIIMFVSQQQGSTGVGCDSYAGAAPHVFLVLHCGCVVHPDYALSLVYLLLETCTQHLTWAGDQGTTVAVHVQVLFQGCEGTESEIFNEFSINISNYYF